jgi:hypothetical protein
VTAVLAAACDSGAGLVPVEHGSGCVMRVQIGLADDWQTVALVALSLVLLSLGVLVVGQLRKAS